MNDTWINWGDFIGKNQGQLDAYDAKVAASQAEQQAAMQAGLARLGTDYSNSAKATEDEYAKLTNILYDNTKDTYRTPGEVANEPDRVSGWGGQFDFATPASPSKPDRVSGWGGQFSFATPAAQSYSALMAAQNSAQANAFKGYQAASAPGWQNAMYGAHAQYVDPWANIQSKVDKLDADFVQRTAAAKASYDAKVADRKASLGTNGKVTGTDANGVPVYGQQQEDPGPRNVPIKPKKDLDPVIGYA
jgi:hypothetical protein